MLIKSKLKFAPHLPVSLCSLFIKAQKTPNPNFLKFLPGEAVMGQSGTMDFPDYKYTHVSPLARRLFTIEGVTRVFFGSNFISVGIENTERWGEVKPEVYEAITDQFSKQAPLFTDEPEREDTKIHEDDSEAVQLIKKILETNIRPFVNEDGGDIEFQGFDEEEGIVRLAMKGSCAGCPSSSITLKNGIEKMLMYYVEEVKTVEAVDFE